MLKKLLLATTVCIALSACNDSSSSSPAPREPLDTLTFSNIEDVSAIARLETSDNSFEHHLIGYDEQGLEIEISNYDVGNFTPTSDGGFVAEVTEKHRSSYYYQTIADQGEVNPPQEKTFRKPVWYYVQSNGIYYFITDKSTEFVGENSKGLLVFSNGDTFNTKHHKSGHLYNSLKLTPTTISNAIKELPDDLTGVEAVEAFLHIVLENKTLEKTKSISEMSGDNLLSNNERSGSFLIESSKGVPINLPDDICDNLDKALLCNKVIIPAIESGIVSGFIGIHKKLNDPSGDVTQILSVPDSKLTLLNTGLLKDDDTVDDSFSDHWDGESALGVVQSYVLSSSFTGQNDCQDVNKQCLYSVVKSEESSGGLRPTITTTIASDFVIDANTGFETDSQAGQIEGGQQNYLWVNDSYIVIKEATQISIIDRADGNKLLDPVLAGTEIDTINLTDDNKLYITTTDSSGQPAAYIYDIASGEGLDTPVSNEKLSAFKALIN